MKTQQHDLDSMRKEYETEKKKTDELYKTASNHSNKLAILKNNYMKQVCISTGRLLTYFNWEFDSESKGGFTLTADDTDNKIGKLTGVWYHDDIYLIDDENLTINDGELTLYLSTQKLSEYIKQGLKVNLDPLLTDTNNTKKKYETKLDAYTQIKKTLDEMKNGNTCRL